MKLLHASHLMPKAKQRPAEEQSAEDWKI